jgi:hypothetical protein
MSILRCTCLQPPSEYPQVRVPESASWGQGGHDRGSFEARCDSSLTRSRDQERSAESEVSDSALANELVTVG